MQPTRVGNAPLSPLAQLARSEVFPGLLLVGCALLAIAVANSPWATTWHNVWHTPFAVRLGENVLEKTVVHWINDGLMTVFFFFIGLEIKHEVLDGQLQSLRQASLPVAAAIGGMVLPASVYWLVVTLRGPSTAGAGWGIPMATDIAFALGVLALVGKGVPPTLKVFLASLAIADDLGAVLVIAVFYTDVIAWQFLGLGTLVLAISYATNRLGVRRTWPYVVYGLLIWLAFLNSGVHATIAGVALALTIPARRHLDEREFTQRGRTLLDEFDRVADDTPRTNPEQLVLAYELREHVTNVQAPLQRMAHDLHSFVAHLIVPVFALANAGVAVTSGLEDAIVHPAAQGVCLGLLVGKPLGIVAACWLAHRLLGSPLPTGMTWRHLHGVSWLAGIGFTMSLFINSLAFANDTASFDAAKLAILLASLLAGILGFAILRRAQSAVLSGKVPPNDAARRE